MKLDANSRCPYCGAGLIQEEDGYRCRLCKSFFPFEEGQTAESDSPYHLTVEKKEPGEGDESRKGTGELLPHNTRNELIGIVTALASAVVMFFCKMKHMPLLMIPGFAIWAFSAGFTAFQVYKAKKSGMKASYIRPGLILVVAILILVTFHVD